MWLQISSDDQILFSIEYRHKQDAEYEDATLNLRDNAWYFVPHSEAKEVWLCKGNLSWQEALKRALTHIAMMK